MAQEAIEARLTDAVRLAEDHLHPEALACLQAIQIADHSGLARYRQQTIDRVAALRTEMLRCNRDRDQAIAEGRELFAACQYEQAAVLLEAVAEPYRTAEQRELLDQVRARQIDMLTLVAEIRRAIAQKQTSNLLPSVEALLRIKPDHPQALALAEQLRPQEQQRMVARRDALYRAAKAHLERYEHAAALAALEQIPQELRTPRLARFIEETAAHAAEVAWLARDLREAVADDEHLLPVAERLIKLRPNDAEATSFVERLRKGKRFVTSRPATSIWGPPLETVADFPHIDVSALISSHFKSHPDRFCVAAGLALQVLERAGLSINFAPTEKAGLLGRFSAKKKPVLSAWGIDVGRAAIKAIRLRLKPGDDRIVADAAEYVEHARMLNAPDGDADVTLRESLDKLCQSDSFDEAPLGISLPAQKVLFRSIALPPVDDKKLAELMAYEVRRQIPIPIENVVWGYQLLGDHPTAVAGVSNCEVALLAMKHDDAQSAVAPFLDRSLKVSLLTSDAAALFNFVMFDRAPSRTRSQAPPGNELLRGSASRAEPCVLSNPVTVILDVGSDSSNLIVASGDALVMRSIPLGGGALSRALVKEFHLTFPQAEKVKRNPTAVRELHRLYSALEPWFADLAREVRRTIESFLQANSSRRVARFIVTGGGIKLHGALRRLWHGA